MDGVHATRSYVMGSTTGGVQNSTATTTTVNESKMDDEWAAEVKALEEVDKWQIIADEKLPVYLRDGFRDFLGQFPGLKVLPVHRLMDTLGWDHKPLEQLLAVLTKLPADLMAPTIELLKSFIIELGDISSNVASGAPPQTELDNMGNTSRNDALRPNNQQVLPAGMVQVNRDYAIVRARSGRSSALGLAATASNLNNSTVQLLPSISVDSRTAGSQDGSNSRKMHLESSAESPVLDSSLVKLCLSICFGLRDYQVVELVQQLPRSDAHAVVQLCRHLPAEEMDFFYDSIDRLSIAELLEMLQLCNEPFAKQCRLCRAKRLNRLEQNMIHELVPAGVMQVPGTMPLYESGTQVAWTACDDLHFTVEPQLGTIYWSPSGKRQPRDTQVDIVRICDACLDDVFKGITNQRRFEPLHHLSPVERLAKIRELRDLEKSVIGEIVWKIEGERHRRRCREFALRALKLQRQGLKQEQEQAAARAAEATRQQQLQAARHAKEALVAQAVSVDKKWLGVDQTAALKDLGIRQTYTQLQQHLGFDGLERNGRRKAPETRKHALTWKLSPYTEEGSPIAKEAAKQIFGQFVPEEYDDKQRIAAWRTVAVERHKAYVERQEKTAREQRERELQELRELRLQVRLKTDALSEARDYDQYMAQVREAERIERRKDDRLRRREERFWRYIEDEREHMVHEDWRSFQLRDYFWQCANEDREREMMFNAEMEQTEVDAFWGFELFERNKNDEERRLRKLYEMKVARMNALLVQTNAIGQFKAPSLMKVGTLHEDLYYGDDEERRKDVIIRKLRAEEVRSQLHTRPRPGYLNEKYQLLHQQKGGGK